MVRFLKQVVLSFVFWTFVVWFGLPVLEEKAPVTYGRLVAIVTDGTLGNRISDAIETLKTKVKKNVKADQPQTFSSKQPKDKGFPRQKNLKTQEQNSSVIENVDGIPQDTLDALNKDPEYPWGIVVTNSFYYDSTMQRIGILAGGTVVERKASKVKMDGSVAECFYLINRLWQDETICLYESDLVMFECTYQDANKTQRDLLVDYCRTQGRLEELRGNAYKEAFRRNPYFEQYKTITEEYKAFTQKAREAKEEFDNARGDKRSVLGDQLRQYHAEETTIMQRNKAIKEKYDAWKIENLGEEKTPKITKTVEMQNLENRLNGMRDAVQELVPGL